MDPLVIARQIVDLLDGLGAVQQLAAIEMSRVYIEMEIQSMNCVPPPPIRE